MSVTAVAGSVAIAGSTGTQTVTLGWQPTVVLLFPRHDISSYGTADHFYAQMGVIAAAGTNRATEGSSVDASTSAAVRGRAQNQAVTIRNTSGSVIAEGTGAIISTGFTINWASVTSGYLWYLALGGDVSDAYVGITNARTTTGTTAITAPGFAPDVVLFWSGAGSTSDEFSVSGNASPWWGWSVNGGSEGGVGTRHVNSANPADTYHITADRCLAQLGTGSTLFEAAVSAWGASGFTLNYTKAAASAWRINYVAIRGGKWANNIGTARTSTGGQTITTTAITPAALLTLITPATALNTIGAHGHVGVGVATASAQFATWGSDVDNVSPTQADRAVQDDVIYVGTGNAPGTAVARADLDAWDDEGVDLDWPTAGAAMRYPWLIVGDVFVDGITLTGAYRTATAGAMSAEVDGIAIAGAFRTATAGALGVVRPDVYVPTGGIVLSGGPGLALVVPLAGAYRTATAGALDALAEGVIAFTTAARTATAEALTVQAEQVVAIDMAARTATAGGLTVTAELAVVLTGADRTASAGELNVATSGSVALTGAYRTATAGSVSVLAGGAVSLVGAYRLAAAGAMTVHAEGVVAFTAATRTATAGVLQVAATAPAISFGAAARTAQAGTMIVTAGLSITLAGAYRVATARALTVGGAGIPEAIVLGAITARRPINVGTITQRGA